MLKNNKKKLLNLSYNWQNFYCMRNIWIFLFSMCFYELIVAQNVKVAPEKPKLIIGIVVSNMRGDFVQRYYDNLCDDGIKLLVEKGKVCNYTRFNFLVSGDGIAQATIVTGANPSVHGIVGREWYEILKENVVGSIEDENYKTVGGSYESGRYSPSKLLTTTFADELRISNNFKSKVFSISMDATHAIFGGGHTANAAYWYDVNTGNFVTSTFYCEKLPDWVNEFNNKKFSDIYLEKTWEPLLSLEKYNTILPDNNQYEEGFNGKNSFPYVLSELSKISRKKYNYEILKMTPFGNNLLKDFATSLIVSEELGKDDYTDILMISFTATEYIGRLFGYHSIELEDAFIRLDRDLAHFIQFINNYIGRENVLIFLTSDKGISPSPKFLTEYKMPSGYFNAGGAISLLNIALNNVYGKGKWIKGYHAQQIYLNRTLIEDSKLSLKDFQEYIAQFMLQFTGVANAIPSYILQRVEYTDGILKKIQNSYNPKTGGDIILVLKPGWVEKNSNSTSLQIAFDENVPLIWYGWKINRGVLYKQIDLVDIAPTISSILQISWPNGCTGKPIFEIFQ